MKTISISLFAAALTIAFAAPLSASPAGKRFGPSFTDAAKAPWTKVSHKAMTHVGPPGKGYVCYH